MEKNIQSDPFGTLDSFGPLDCLGSTSVHTDLRC